MQGHRLDVHVGSNFTVVVVVVLKGKFVRRVFIQKYLRRACRTLTQTASSLGYVWTAPGARSTSLRMFEGRPFQVEGSSMRKLRLPKRVVSAWRTTRSPWSADHSRDRAATMWTGVHTSRRYFGHRPWWQSNVISAILKVTRCVIGSQCNVSRSVDVMWSLRRIPVISRAATCRTDCSRR